MSSATLKMGADQRDVTRQYLEAQVSRAASEKREADRQSGVAKSENDGAARLRSEVESARRSTLQEAESLRSRATTTLDQAAQCQSTADGLVHLLRRRGDLLALNPPAARQDNLGDPERVLNQSLQVAKEALGEMQAALRELAELESGAERLRLLLATIAVALVTGLLGHFWGSTPAFVVFPLLLAAAMSAFRLDHGVIFLDRLMSYAARKRAEASEKPWYSVPRNYFGGLTAIRNSTNSIGNPYIQSGTRAAATMYFTGSAAGVVVAAGYALVAVVVAVLMIGVVIWVIGKMLENV